MENKIYKSELYFIFILLILSIIYRMFFIYMPLDREEGTYAYIAERIEKGELPYKDIFVNKQPFIFYIYKTAFKFLGTSYEAIRIFTNFYILVMLLVFYSFIREFFNKWLSLLILFFFIMHLNNHNIHGLNSNTEIFIFLPVFVAYIFLCSTVDKYFHINLFLTGFFIGIATFIKLIAAFILFVALIYILKYFKKNKIKYILWLFSGFITLVILLFLWCIKNNMLKEFIEYTFFYNFNNLLRFDLKNTFFILIKNGWIFIKTNLILFVGFLYGLYLFFKNKKIKIIFLSLLSSLLFFIYISFSPNYYPLYYLVLIPFLSILSAIFINEFYLFLCKKTNNKKIAVSLAIIAVVIYSLYFIKINNFLNFIKSNYKTKDIYYEAKAIAEIINLNKKEKQNILVFANEPEIYFYTHTQSPFKYIYNYPASYKLNELNDEFILDFLIVDLISDNEYKVFLEKNFKKVVEFKNLILYESKGDKNEKNK